MPRFPALNVTPKTGDESFHNQGQPADFQVLDFWRWGVSDLVNNASSETFSLAPVVVAVPRLRPECRKREGVLKTSSADRPPIRS